jgi:tripartite-type tricarboxylate transporter receptor subunit TctC
VSVIATQLWAHRTLAHAEDWPVIGVVHVPYRCDAPELTDLTGGQVQVMFDLMIASINYIRAESCAL